MWLRAIALFFLDIWAVLVQCLLLQATARCWRSGWEALAHIHTSSRRNRPNRNPAEAAGLGISEGADLQSTRMTTTRSRCSWPQPG